MSNINRLVQESELILETLIDKLFNLFEKPFDRSKISLEEYDRLINKALDNNVNIELKLKLEEDKNINVPKGLISTYYNSITNNEVHQITIFIPKNITESNHLMTLMFDTILHELTHVITTTKIPTLIKTKKQGKQIGSFNTLDINISSLDIGNLSSSSVKEFLDYVLHIREISNFAFTIAYACRNDFKVQNLNISKLYSINDSILNEYFSGNTSSFANWTNKIKNSDIYTLLEIQLAVRYLNSKVYYNKLQKFIKLCIKYENRLIKLLG